MRDAMPGMPEQQERDATKSWPEPTPYRIDLLFVIDDSPGMQPFAAPLADAMRSAIGELDTIDEDVDLHIGVITADLGDEQERPYQPVPGQCAGWGDAAQLRRSVFFDGSYLRYRDVRGEASTNAIGPVSEALSDLAAVGTAGCAHARPLEAMRLALDHDVHDGGFLRDNAELGVVIVAGQEDESPRTVADYVTFLKQLGRDVGVVVFGGAPLRHDCGPATDRLYAFSQLFPNRGTFVSNCGLAGGGLAAYAVGNLLPGFGPPIANLCFDAPLADIDPETPGIQPDCSVTEYVDRGRAGEQQHVLAHCGTGALPCWRIVEDDDLCSGFQHLRIEVNRGGEDPPDNDVVEAQCVSS